MVFGFSLLITIILIVTWRWIIALRCLVKAGRQLKTARYFLEHGANWQAKLELEILRTRKILGARDTEGLEEAARRTVANRLGGSRTWS